MLRDIVSIDVTDEHLLMHIKPTATPDDLNRLRQQLEALIQQVRARSGGARDLYLVALSPHPAAKLNAMKAVRNITGLGLRDSRALVDGALPTLVRTFSGAEPVNSDSDILYLQEWADIEWR